MLIYVVRTFRGYFVTASKEAADLKAIKLYDELKRECEEFSVKKDNVWCRIDIYHAAEKMGSPFVYRDSQWINKNSGPFYFKF